MLMTAAILAIFVYGLIAAFLGTILPDLSTKFNLTPKQNGTIASVQAMGLIIASLAGGPVVDNQGKKVALVLGLALISIALLLLPRSRGFRSIAFLLFLLGMGGGIVVTGANALVSDVGEAHRATALTFVNLFFGLGGLVTPFLSANLFRGNSWRLGYTIALLTIGTLGFQLMTKIPGPTGARSFVLSSAGTALGRPALLLLGLVLFLYVSCEVGIWNWLVQHLIAQGIPEARALNVLSLGFALGLLLGRMVLSPVLMRVPGLTVVMIASVCMAITTALLINAKSATSAGALVFLAGISMAPVFPTTVAIAGDLFSKMTGTAIGIVITCGWIGLAVSSRMIGAIASGDPKRLKKALMIIPAFSVGIFVLNVALRFAI
jgi:MFS transporter, FHS family, glucose/mannose:H+ symporter